MGRCWTPVLSRAAEYLWASRRVNLRVTTTNDTDVVFSRSLRLPLLAYKLRLPQFSKSIFVKLTMFSTNSRSPSEENSRALSSSSLAAPPWPSPRRSRLRTKGCDCGPSVNPYSLLKISKTVSNRFSNGIQWYRSPLGNGHVFEKLERRNGIRYNGMVVASMMNLDMYGDCIRLDPGLFVS